MPAETPSALPDVAIGRHPDHGIVAALPTQSAAAQWMLERLEFQRIPGHPSLYALTDQQREAPERAAWAIKLLNGAGYRVDADAALAPSAAVEQARARAGAPSPRGQEPDPGPDVAFAEHPRLGVVAAVGGHQPLSPAVFLEVDGWRWNRDLDIYLPPPVTNRAEALDAVARSTLSLRRGHYQVAMQPELAEAVAANRAPLHQAFTTHKFRVDEASLAKSPAARPTSTTKAILTAGPPTAAVDPRVAFARAR
ncbi:hypothetical protein [Kitasatospora sp. NPDC090091]|uniref:hypothetical protein n=1 Tax=Kitasatospora sp. NPDC090091 TaxID=3364081 RepID=UPI0037F99E6F